MAYMATKDGRLLESPYDVSADDFDIQYLAQSLSRTARFLGRGARFLSVAEHSVTVSHLVPAELAACALMHDAPEAFVGDMHSNIKQLLLANGEESFKFLEQWFWEMIATKYGLPIDMPSLVHQADLAARKLEMDELFYDAPTREVPPWEAEELFVARAEALGLVG